MINMTLVQAKELITLTQMMHDAHALVGRTIPGTPASRAMYQAYNLVVQRKEELLEEIQNEHDR